MDSNRNVRMDTLKLVEGRGYVDKDKLEWIEKRQVDMS